MEVSQQLAVHFHFNPLLLCSSYFPILSTPYVISHPHHIAKQHPTSNPPPTPSQSQLSSLLKTSHIEIPNLRPSFEHQSSLFPFPVELSTRSMNASIPPLDVAPPPITREELIEDNILNPQIQKSILTTVATYTKKINSAVSDFNALHSTPSSSNIPPQREKGGKSVNPSASSKTDDWATYAPIVLPESDPLMVWNDFLNELQSHIDDDTAKAVQHNDKGVKQKIQNDDSDENAQDDQSPSFFLAYLEFCVLKFLHHPYYVNSDLFFDLFSIFTTFITDDETYLDQLDELIQTRIDQYCVNHKFYQLYLNSMLQTHNTARYLRVLSWLHFNITPTNGSSINTNTLPFSHQPGPESAQQQRTARPTSQPSPNNTSPTQPLPNAHILSTLPNSSQFIPPPTFFSALPPLPRALSLSKTLHPQHLYPFSLLPAPLTESFHKIVGDTSYLREKEPNVFVSYSPLFDLPPTQQHSSAPSHGIISTTTKNEHVMDIMQKQTHYPEISPFYAKVLRFSATMRQNESIWGQFWMKKYVQGDDVEDELRANANGSTQMDDDDDDINFIDTDNDVEYYHDSDMAMDDDSDDYHDRQKSGKQTGKSAKHMDLGFTQLLSGVSSAEPSSTGVPGESSGIYVDSDEDGENFDETADIAGTNGTKLMGDKTTVIHLMKQQYGIDMNSVEAEAKNREQRSKDIESLTQSTTKAPNPLGMQQPPSSALKKPVLIGDSETTVSLGGKFLNISDEDEDYDEDDDLDGPRWEETGDMTRNIMAMRRQQMEQRAKQAQIQSTAIYVESDDDDMGTQKRTQNQQQRESQQAQSRGPVQLGPKLTAPTSRIYRDSDDEDADSNQVTIHKTEPKTAAAQSNRPLPPSQRPLPPSQRVHDQNQTQNGHLQRTALSRQSFVSRNTLSRKSIAATTGGARVTLRGGAQNEKNGQPDDHQKSTSKSAIYLDSDDDDDNDEYDHYPPPGQSNYHHLTQNEQSKALSSAPKITTLQSDPKSAIYVDSDSDEFRECTEDLDDAVHGTKRPNAGRDVEEFDKRQRTAQSSSSNGGKQSFLVDADAGVCSPSPSAKPSSSDELYPLSTTNNTTQQSSQIQIAQTPQSTIQHQHQHQPPQLSPTFPCTYSNPILRGFEHLLALQMIFTPSLHSNAQEMPLVALYGRKVRRGNWKAFTADALSQNSTKSPSLYQIIRPKIILHSEEKRKGDKGDKISSKNKRNGKKSQPDQKSDMDVDLVKNFDFRDVVALYDQELPFIDALRKDLSLETYSNEIDQKMQLCAFFTQNGLLIEYPSHFNNAVDNKLVSENDDPNKEHHADQHQADLWHQVMKPSTKPYNLEDLHTKTISQIPRIGPSWTHIVTDLQSTIFYNLTFSHSFSTLWVTYLYATLIQRVGVTAAVYRVSGVMNKLSLQMKTDTKHDDKGSKFGRGKQIAQSEDHRSSHITTTSQPMCIILVDDTSSPFTYPTPKSAAVLSHTGTTSDTDDSDDDDSWSRNRKSTNAAKSSSNDEDDEAQQTPLERESDMLKSINILHHIGAPIPESFIHFITGSQNDATVSDRDKSIVEVVDSDNIDVELLYDGLFDKMVKIVGSSGSNNRSSMNDEDADAMMSRNGQKDGNSSDVALFSSPLSNQSRLNLDQTPDTPHDAPILTLFGDATSTHPLFSTRAFESNGELSSIALDGIKKGKNTITPSTIITNHPRKQSLFNTALPPCTVVVPAIHPSNHPSTFSDILLSFSSKPPLPNLTRGFQNTFPTITSPTSIPRHNMSFHQTDISSSFLVFLTSELLKALFVIHAAGLVLHGFTLDDLIYLPKTEINSKIDLQLSTFESTQKHQPTTALKSTTDNGDGFDIASVLTHYLAQHNNTTPTTSTPTITTTELSSQTTPIVEGKFQLKISPKVSDLGLCMLAKTQHVSFFTQRQNPHGVTSTNASSNAHSSSSSLRPGSSFFTGFDIPETMWVDHPETTRVTIDQSESKLRTTSSGRTTLSSRQGGLKSRFAKEETAEIESNNVVVVVAGHLIPSQNTHYIPYVTPPILAAELSNQVMFAMDQTKLDPSKNNKFGKNDKAFNNSKTFNYAHVVDGSVINRFNPNSTQEDAKPDLSQLSLYGRQSVSKYIFELDIYSALRIITVLSNYTSQTQQKCVNHLFSSYTNSLSESQRSQLNSTATTPANNAICPPQLKEIEKLINAGRQRKHLSPTDRFNQYYNHSLIPIYSDLSNNQMFPILLTTHPILACDQIACNLISFAFAYLLSVAQSHHNLNSFAPPNSLSSSNLTSNLTSQFSSANSSWFESYHSTYLIALSKVISLLDCYFKPTHPSSSSSSSSSTRLEDSSQSDLSDNLPATSYNLSQQRLHLVRTFLKGINNDFGFG